MARIAKFRATIDTERGEVSRLGHRMIDVGANTRDFGASVRLSDVTPHTFTLTFKSVHYITNGGAVFNEQRRFDISERDMADIISGKKRLLIVDTEQLLREAADILAT